ncbi:MAG: hypothetical protein Q8L81_17715 [Bacteroidota bacterium]|nr:hypothetical protein [Bacteroidota bacterium]
MKKFCFSLFIFICFFIRAQKDSVLAKADSSFNNGLYIKYSDWRYNTPIHVDSITCKKESASTSVYTKLDNNNYITYTRKGKTEKVHVNSVWGYMENKKLYVYFAGKFQAVNYTGTICMFMILAYRQTPTFTMNTPNKHYTYPTNKAFQPFLISFYNSAILTGSPEQMCKLLKPDPELYQEYKALDKEKQIELMKQYVVKYNKLHPFYILK